MSALAPEQVAAACNARRTGENQWLARCPAHDDRKPSLSIGAGDNGEPVVYCHAGCPQPDVLAALKTKYGLDLRNAAGKRGGKRARGASKNHRARPSNGNGSADPETFVAIVPPPEDPVVDEIRSPRLGEPVAVFRYRNAAGETEGFVRRFNTTDADGKPDKMFLPLRYGTFKGFAGWHSKGWGDERPLYRLPELLTASDAPVVVTEGERKADRAAALFPGFAAVAPMNGAKSPAKTDWSPLRGRAVAIWPDNDEAGAKFARTVVKLLTAAGVAAVAIVHVPDSFPPKWDLADEAPAGVDLRAILDAAQPWTTTRETTPEARDDAPSAIDLINSEYALLQHGGSVIVIRTSGEEPVFLSVSAMHAWFANKRVVVDDKMIPASKYWMAHPNRRQYDRVVFRPGGGEASNELNLWTGWGLEPRKVEHSWIIEHIHDVICNHEKELFDYTIRWLAHLVQRPAEKPEVALVLRGGKGVGKDTFAVIASKIVGKRHVAMVDRPDLLTGRFNGHFASALLAHVQEAFWSGDRSRKGTLQALITSATISLERKGLDPITIDSYLRIIMTTNEDWAIPASHDERRYLVLDVSDARHGDRDYFEALYAEVNGEALRGFLDYLLQLDLTGWNPRDVPQTSGLIDQKLESLENFERWWFDLLSTGKLPAPEGPFGTGGTAEWGVAPMISVNKELMRESYHSFLRARRFAGDPISAAMFGRKIASFGGVTVRAKEDDEGKRAWEYRLLPLDRARARFETFIGGPIRWHDND